VLPHTFARTTVANHIVPHNDFIKWDKAKQLIKFDFPVKIRANLAPHLLWPLVSNDNRNIYTMLVPLFSSISTTGHMSFTYSCAVLILAVSVLKSCTHKYYI
jgi:hypothetical protein